MHRNTKALVGRTLTAAFGRRTLAKAARYLTNVARLDVPNDIQSNGELLIQHAVISHSSSQSPTVIFDIGANVGEWTIPLLCLCRQSNLSNIAVHAFEPVMSTMRVLEANTRSIQTAAELVLVKKAASDSSGISTMSIINEASGINAISPDPDQNFKYIETVETTTIDEYCESLNIKRVALIKIDTEGHDCNVLQGAARMLRDNAVQIVQFEYNHRWIWSRSYLRDVFEIANRTGYHIGKVTPVGIEAYLRWHPELEHFQEGNYVMCRPDWVPKLRWIDWWNASVYR